MYLVLLLLFVSLLLQNLHQSVKFRNHENDLLQITRYKSLIEVLILLYYSNIRIFSVDFRRTKVRRRIRISAAAWGRTGGRSAPDTASLILVAIAAVSRQESRGCTIGILHLSHLPFVRVVKTSPVSRS